MLSVHHVHHVPKCMGCHIIIELIIRRAHGFHDYTYVLRTYSFCMIWGLCVSWCCGWLMTTSHNYFNSKMEEGILFRSNAYKNLRIKWNDCWKVKSQFCPNSCTNSVVELSTQKRDDWRWFLHICTKVFWTN